MPDETYTHKFFCQLPNCITHMGLKKEELSLLMAIAITAGKDGICTKSRLTLAREAGMNPKTLDKARNKLQKEKLIRVTRSGNKHGGSDRYFLAPNWKYLWKLNDLYYEVILVERKKKRRQSVYSFTDDEPDVTLKIEDINKV
jgi:hypothetical protein